MDAVAPIRFALVGNPNCGKTALFNRLTGARAKVANYAGVTVEKRSGPLTGLGRDAELIDLPGTYSLFVTSPDEQVTRNVLLGKIQPAWFPKVFGPQANEPLDRDGVVTRFARMAAEVRKSTGREATPEGLAEGFLQIAVQNMANAIKRISVARGYDVTQYTLQCFGGAGGQHACLVADALAMSRVFVHPLAGVLSAYSDNAAVFAGSPGQRSCARSIAAEASSRAQSSSVAGSLRSGTVREPALPR